eukprot:TRINITY_DN20505_c1_g1_i1.p1 TRINITY_DN20505_c1_g1~~TRINITY_DN20505_c1_g1_i1.p1  ORF type:complete len:477 (+),score=180.86 TRINITY_DN20505_c1_g1_i1:83-1432(+)
MPSQKAGAAAANRIAYFRSMPWGAGKKDGAIDQVAERHSFTGATDATKIKKCDFIVIGDDTETDNDAEDRDRRRKVLAEAAKLADSSATKAKNAGAYKKKCEAAAFLALYQGNSKEISFKSAKAGDLRELEKLKAADWADELSDEETPGSKNEPSLSGRRPTADAGRLNVTVSIPENPLYAIADAIRQNADALFINSVIRAEAGRCADGGRAELADGVLGRFKRAYESKEEEVEAFHTLRDKKEVLEEEQRKLEEEIRKKQKAIDTTERCDLPEETKDELLEEARKKVAKLQKRLELVMDRLADKRSDYDKQSTVVDEAKEESRSALRECTKLVGEFSSPQMHQLAKRPRWDVDGMLRNYCVRYQSPVSVRGPSVPPLDLDDGGQSTPRKQPPPGEEAAPSEPAAVVSAAAPSPAAAAPSVPAAPPGDVQGDDFAARFQQKLESVTDES